MAVLVGLLALAWWQRAWIGDSISDVRDRVTQESSAPVDPTPHDPRPTHTASAD